MSPQRIEVGNVEFDAVESKDLEPLAVVAQCLDNQWVPQPMLRRMLDKGLSLADVGKDRLRLVRGEYLRALVNAKQVVVNRSFLYNNQAIFRDYQQSGDDRDAFRALLNAGVIAPFLFDERTPQQRPEFTADSDGFRAWEQICEEVRTRCVRLSWDDTLNDQIIDDQLSRRLQDFALRTVGLHTPTVIRDLGLDPQAESPLRSTLAQVTRKCTDWLEAGQKVTREKIYRDFVVAPGTTPVEGRYAATRPFAGAIKQLVDLDYNVNLPDALERYPLTPADSLRRTALQEWQKVQKAEPVSVDRLVTLLRQTVFEHVQAREYIASLGELTLADVGQLRSTDEWHRYMGSLEGLVANPFEFPDPARGASAVLKNYVAVAARATEIGKKRKTQIRTAAWTPRAEFVIDVAGAVLSVVFVAAAAPPLVSVVGAVAPVFANRAAPVVVRLVVRGVGAVESRANLSTSIDIIHGRLDQATDEWNEIVHAFKDKPEFEQAKSLVDTTRQATIEHPADE